VSWSTIIGGVQAAGKKCHSAKGNEQAIRSPRDFLAAVGKVPRKASLNVLMRSTRPEKGPLNDTSLKNTGSHINEAVMVEKVERLRLKPRMVCIGT
jgi:hypothetical protein